MAHFKSVKLHAHKTDQSSKPLMSMFRRCRERGSISISLWDKVQSKQNKSIRVQLRESESLKRVRPWSISIPSMLYPLPNKTMTMMKLSSSSSRIIITKTFRPKRWLKNQTDSNRSLNLIYSWKLMMTRKKARLARRAKRSILQRLRSLKYLTRFWRISSTWSRW